MSLETILLIFGFVVVVVVLFKVFGKKKTSPARRRPAKSTENLADLQIQDAEISDTLILSGAAEDFEDISFTIDRKYRYEDDGFSWYELSGKHRGKRINLEWSEDDELEVFLNIKKGIKLALLGLTPKDLERMADKQSSEETVDFDGRQWSFESCQDVLFFRDDADEGEGFTVWDFTGPDADQKLYVEKWEGDPHEAGLTQCIDSSTITVFRK